MKQNKTSREKFLETCFTEEDIQVAEILLDLGNSVVASDWRSNLSWGRKRRRSALDAAPSSTLAPSSSSPSVEIGIAPPRVKPEVESTSPTTPLSFSPSESDEKSNQSPKTSKKKKREKYMEKIEKYMTMIEGLTESRDLLKGEVKNVTNYLNQLKAQNLELKFMKQKVISHMKEESHMGMSKFLNLEMNLPQHYHMTAVAHQQPFILDQMATGSSSSQISENIHYPFIPIAPPSNGLGHSNQVGQDGLPDLNLSLEEDFGVDPSQPLDIERELADKRARFAEARRLRRGIIKNKVMKCGLGGAKPLRSR